MLLNKQRKYYKVLNREFNKLNKKNRSTKVFNKALPGVVFHYPTYDEVIEKQVTFMRYRITIYVSIVLCILSSCGMKRSEERRVGKECRAWYGTEYMKDNDMRDWSRI